MSKNTFMSRTGDTGTSLRVKNDVGRVNAEMCVGTSYDAMGLQQQQMAAACQRQQHIYPTLPALPSPQRTQSPLAAPLPMQATMAISPPQPLLPMPPAPNQTTYASDQALYTPPPPTVPAEFCIARKLVTIPFSRTFALSDVKNDLDKSGAIVCTLSTEAMNNFAEEFGGRSNIVGISTNRANVTAIENGTPFDFCACSDFVGCISCVADTKGTTFVIPANAQYTVINHCTFGRGPTPEDSCAVLIALKEDEFLRRIVAVPSDINCAGATCWFRADGDSVGETMRDMVVATFCQPVDDDKSGDAEKRKKKLFDAHLIERTDAVGGTWFWLDASMYTVFVDAVRKTYEWINRSVKKLDPFSTSFHVVWPAGTGTSDNKLDRAIGVVTKGFKNQSEMQSYVASKRCALRIEYQLELTLFLRR